MRIPITQNYDNDKAIGWVYTENDELYFEFNKEERILRECLFDILGTTGLQILESVYDDNLDDIYFTKGKIMMYVAHPDSYLDITE